MKATILGKDLIKLLGKYGDSDVQMCISMKDGREIVVDVKCIDEVANINTATKAEVMKFEIYGEEQ